MSSVAARLKSDLDALTNRIADLIGDLPIEHRDGISGPLIFVTAPAYIWGKASPKQVQDQLAIKRDYEDWFAIFESVFSRATDDVNQRIKRVDRLFRIWIELRYNYSITHDRKTNEEKLRADAGPFYELLAILDANGDTRTILIPDTNAIINEPDPVRYRTIACNDSFVFLLLPTVLGELDSLKTNHRNPAVRDKARGAIARIKGWRKQGNLREGVTVSQSITVRAVANEPTMGHSLSWLDENNRDDQIIASVLEVQSVHSNARVILVTGDINLLNKADVARIETAELEFD